MTETLNDVQAAQLLGLSPQTLRNWRTQRKGPPYVKLGRAIRYHLEDLRDYIASRRIVPEASDQEGQAGESETATSEKTDK